MKQIIRLIQLYWPLFLLVFFEGILFSANFTPHTYLVGWDNMFPEFDLALNLKRTLFATWQEYRGLGYQDGMSHAANLIHYLLLWILSLAIPQQLLRYVFVFGMHLIGGIGMYFLLSNIQRDSSQKPRNDIVPVVALFSALFYQYCFATVQMFYLPFELFLIQFASLPWIFLTLSKFLTYEKKRDAMLFGLVMLLATPQAHVPTVFLVTALAVGMYLLWGLIVSKGASLKRIVLVVGIAFCMNAFWGIPFTYSTIARSSIITGSKNNQIATEDIFEKNHAFGGFVDTAEMKSFALTYIYYDYKKLTNDYIMKPWINHIDAPLVQGVLLSLFSLAAIGFFLAIQKRDTTVAPYALIFLFSFLAIGNDIPIFSSFSWLIRTYVPYVSDIFRFVFTKFFFLYAFSFAILVSYALSELTTWIIKKRQILSVIPICLATIMLLITTIPSFQGNFLYENLRVNIPQEYFQVSSFFKKQPSDGRILVLPMPWYWGWTQYRWGVIGSGFTWFGIRQPLIDRAFDPWSNFNENVYWEFSQAIYEKNAERFAQLVKKYDIRWIMIDENIMHPTNDKALYLSQIDTLLQTNSSIQKEEAYGRIRLYSVGQQTNSTVTMESNVPNIGPSYIWNDNDQAYTDFGPYITTDKELYDIYYPFRSLFTGHEQNEKEFSIKLSNEALTFTGYIPSYFENQEVAKIIPLTGSATFDFQKDPIPTFTVTVPITHGTEAYNSSNTEDLKKLISSCDASRKGKTNAQWENQNNGYRRLESISASTCLDIGIPDLSQRNGYIVVVRSRHIQGRRLFISITNEQTKKTFLESYVTDKRSATDFTNSFFVIPPMDEFGIGYRITMDNLSVDNDTTINDISSVRVYTIPYEKMVGMKIQKSEVGSQRSDSSITLTSVDHPNPAYYKIKIMENGEWKMENTALILSQSFDKGWRAYTIQNAECRMQNFFCRIQNWLSLTFPFLFGKELKDHVLVNNWENAWVIQMGNGEWKMENNGNIIILFFLPQLLEWLGFALLPIPFLLLLVSKR